MILNFDFDAPLNWSAAQFKGELCTGDFSARVEQAQPGHLKIVLPYFGRSLLWVNHPVGATDTCQILVPFHAEKPFALKNVIQKLHSEVQRWGHTEASLGVFVTLIDDHLLPSMVVWRNDDTTGPLDDRIAESQATCLEAPDDSLNHLWNSLKITITMRTVRYTVNDRLVLDADAHRYSLDAKTASCTPWNPATGGLRPPPGGWRTFLGLPPPKEVNRFETR